MREAEISLLYPPGYEPPQDGAVVADPGIVRKLAGDTLFAEMRAATKFRPNQKSPFVYATDDAEVIRYRLDAVEDLLEHDALRRMLAGLLPELEEMKELLHVERDQPDDTASALTSISEIELYIGLVDRLNTFFERERLAVRSAGFRSLMAEVGRVASDESYCRLKAEYAKLSDSIRDIRSITIGVNLDEQFRPGEAGIVAINTERFRSGHLIDKLLRIDFGDDRFHCLAPLQVVGRGLSQEQQFGFRAAVNSSLNELFRSSIKSWRPVVRHYVRAHTKPFARLAEELRFLLGGAAMIRQLIAAGMPVCRPEARPKEERAFEVEGLYHPALVLDRERAGALQANRVVRNSLRFDSDGMLYVLTGPNQGGKTVFVQSVGLAQLLFQLGLYVPASSAALSPVERIHLHFPEESERGTTGRFGDECRRLSDICGRINAYSLLLMDETFSGTSASEAVYIAEQVMLGLAAARCRVLFSTHLHELAGEVDELNRRAEAGAGKIDTLVAEMDEEQPESGSRSYVIRRARPTGASYARDIAAKYGLTYENLMRSLGRRDQAQ